MPEPTQPPPDDVTPDTAQPSASPPAAPGAVRPRRRWPRRIACILLVGVVVLALLVGFAPTIVSLPPVHNAILATINGSLRGTVQVAGLSLSWNGPLEVRGLRVTDAAQQPVLQVQRATIDTGVWRLITSTFAVGEIVVESPVVLIDEQHDGQITLVQAFQPRVPSPPSSQPTTWRPTLAGRLIVKRGTVKVVRAGAGSYEVNDFNAQAELDSSRDGAGQFDLALADGTKLTGETTVRGLLTQGGVDLSKANGTLRLKTDRPVQVGPLAALVGQTGLAGGVSLDIDAALAAGALQGQLALNVAGLQSASRAAAKAAPINAQLQGRVHWGDKKLTANLDLSGEAGQARVALTYQHSDRPLDITADRIGSAVLTGEPLTLPDFTVEAQAGIDIARLGQAVPELLGVRAGVELTGGKLEITKLTVQGGAQPAAHATLTLKDVAARRGDRPVQLAALAFNLDSIMEPGQGLRVRQLELQSGFAQLSASGLASDLHATFKTNLGELRRELDQVFDFGAIDLAGELNGNVALKRADDTQVDVALQAGVEQFRYAGGGRTLELPRAALTHTGQFVLAEQKLTKVVATQTKVDLNGELVASAAGGYDVQQQGFEAELEVARGDLAFVASRAKALGIAELARYSGALLVKAHVERAAGTQPWLTRGELTVQNLGVDGQPVVAGATKVSWSGAQLASDGQSLQLAAAQLESACAQLTAKDVRLQSGKKFALTGQINVAADVARCLKAAAPVAKWAQPPDLAGQLALNATGTLAGAVLSLTGQGTVEQCVIGMGTTAIREPRVQLACDVQVDQDRRVVSLNKCNLASKLLTADVSGKVADYTEQCQLNLKGRYSASCEALTALLHQVAPSTAETVRFAGTSASEFKITGPLRQPDAQPAFRGVRAGATVTWSAAELFGLKLGAAELAPVLKDGQLTQRKTAIPIADGQANVAGVVDFQTAEPAWKLAGKLQLLENVALTKALGAELLGRINPVFMHVAKIEGRVNLRVQDVLVPLGQSLKERSAAQGRLDLSQVKMRPSGLLGELLSLGGLEAGSAYPVAIGALNFVMKNGRILYDNFTLTFPGKFDLKFRGSVGLDETLDLVVSVPVRAELLNKLGVKGATAEYAKLLGDTRVDIPLVGTRAKPQLDFAKVDVQSLLKNILLKQPDQQIEGLLKGLPGGAEKKR